MAVSRLSVPCHLASAGEVNAAVQFSTRTCLAVAQKRDDETLWRSKECFRTPVSLIVRKAAVKTAAVPVSYLVIDSDLFIEARIEGFTFAPAGDSVFACMPPAGFAADFVFLPASGLFIPLPPFRSHAP